MAALVCDRNDLMAFQPCLQCLSTKQLLGVIALALCKIVGADPNAECDPAVLLENASSLNQLNDKQKLQALAALILNWGIDNDYIVSETDLRSDISCLMCLDDAKILSIILQLICTGVADGTILCAVRN